MNIPCRSVTVAALICAVLALGVAPTAWAEPGVSIDKQRPCTVGCYSPDMAVEPYWLKAGFGAPLNLAFGSLISPPLPVGVGEIQDFTYGDETPLFPASIEFSVGPGLAGAPSTGHPLAPAPPAPAFDVRMEAGVAGFDGTVDADIFATYPSEVLGPPACSVGSNRQIIDENGHNIFPSIPRLSLSFEQPWVNVDGYERNDETFVGVSALLPQAPVFFTIDAATAALWPAPIPAPGGTVAMPGPSDLLAWNPSVQATVIYATAGALGLTPADDIDALALSYPTGSAALPPAAPGWDMMPVGPIVFSLAAGSPSLSVTSGGSSATPLTPACFGAGAGTAADLWVVSAPVAQGGATGYLSAEQLGLGTIRSGAPTDDEIDAVDICNAFRGSDIDLDMIDDGCDFDMEGDGLGNGFDTDDEDDGFLDPTPVAHEGPANTNAAVDNCPDIPNDLQLNADGNFIELDTKAFDDLTWPRSDAVGDDCDTDDDNDGLSDQEESAGPPCASASAPTSPFTRDSDGDRVLDGAECVNGTNPNSSSSFPAGSVCHVAGDADGDGVLDSRERCFYNTLTTVANSDGDTLADDCEIASINADQLVNVIDLQQVAQSVPPSGTAGYYVDFDVSKDGSVNVLDLQFVAARSVPCP